VAQIPAREEEEYPPKKKNEHFPRLPKPNNFFFVFSFFFE
jgi:hypothetical protein